MPDGPDHPETWIFHLAMAWLGDPDHTLTYQERLAMIKERAKEMAEPARSAFTWIPDDVLVHRADISYWISKPWDNRGGRMTLVGDAAHPMPPCKLPLSSPKSNILKNLIRKTNTHPSRPRPRTQPLHLRLLAPSRCPQQCPLQHHHSQRSHLRLRRRDATPRSRRGEVLIGERADVA
jgi:hypothetical protein